MDEKKKDKLNEEALSRRSFLTGLGKWSAVVIAAAAVGVSKAAASEAPKEELCEDDEMRPDGAAHPHDPEVEEQWWRCRVWGNGGHRHHHRCRVWGNTAGCRVWGNASGCRVWGNRN